MEPGSTDSVQANVREALVKARQVYMARRPELNRCGDVGDTPMVDRS
jgi:hypothetical protein